MATATKIQLVEFNKDEALNGASLAFSSNGQLSGTVSDYVLNFQLNDIGSVTEKYSGQVQKKMYYFNDNGICSDGNELHNLFIVDAEIIATQGTTATRGDAGKEENIDIDVLQPREYFAMYALQGEDRVLRGYKIQFESRDGRYDCVDMDITKTDKESGIRPVNILTIKWLIFNGVKYIVE